jgi:predicted MPP superfamily phosphohydrolase
MKHMIIPDTQAAPGHPDSHMEWAGKYAVEKKPDVIIHIGDHWDMPSLSSYDKGKGAMEGRRYMADIEAGNSSMDKFMRPIIKEQKRLRKNKEKVWKPRLVFCLGNHEERITRAINDNIQLDDLIGFHDFNLESYGWEVKPFLEVTVIDGVAYSHYFTSGVMGRPVSSARLMLTKKHMSCVMGHVQDRDIAFAKAANGRCMTGIFAGIFYQHDESYLNAQTNGSWAGLWMLHQVQEGSFDEMPVSLDYLKRKYG